MAGSASFTTKDGTITLMSGTNDPFLNYSISVGEVVKAGDGTVLDIIYNISVDGLFVAEGDITTDGARLANLIGKQKGRWQTAANMEDLHGTLLLTSPNGTQAFTGYAELTRELILLSLPDVMEAKREALGILSPVASLGALKRLENIVDCRE